MLENCDYFAKNCEIEDIKRSFKLALHVEQCCATLKAKIPVEKLVHCLKIANFDIYENACDSLLRVFFETSNVKANTVDIALRIYTSLVDEDRLQVVFKQLILKSFSVKALLSFTIENKEYLNINELQHSLILCKVTQAVHSNNSNFISDAFLNNSCIKSELPGLMCAVINENADANIQEIVADKLCKKATDAPLLFWPVVVKNVSAICVLQFCLLRKEFLSLFLDFCVSCLSINFSLKLVNDRKVWFSDSLDLSYDELVAFLVNLCKNDEIKKAILEKFEFVAKNNALLIFRDVILELQS